MRTKEELRFIDKDTFQEAAPPEDRSRPLEWRRSFNTINFEVCGLAVEYVYSINEIDHFSAIAGNSEQKNEPVVSAASKTRARISGELDRETFRDSLFYAKETEKDDSYYQLCRIQGPIQVSFFEAEPTELRGPYKQGAFPGLAFWADFDSGIEDLSIDLGVPKEQLQDMAARIRDGHANALHAVVGIQSFSYEVDDALSEWYHPRDLFIHGSAVQAVLISSRLSNRQNKIEPTIEAFKEEGDEPVVAAAPAPVAPDYSPILKGIKTAMWVLAGLMLFQLFK